VSNSVIHASLVALLGLLLGAIVLFLARRGLLSLRYTIGWFGIASLGLLGAIIVPVVQPIAGALDLSAAALMAFVAVAVLLAITVQLSVSISGIQRQIANVVDELARMKYDNRSKQPDQK